MTQEMPSSMPHQSSSTKQSCVTHTSTVYGSTRSSNHSRRLCETLSTTVPRLTLVFALISLGLGSFSSGNTANAQPASSEILASPPHPTPQPSNLKDLSGLWEIQEDDKTYQATLDSKGNGPYTHEQGSFTTTELDGRLWSGNWKQRGNDREGGFEVLLSEDYKTAEGVWWYTRVKHEGEHKNVPPRMHGGSYFFKRISPANAQQTKHE